jgi:hypothetical protein
VFSAKLGPKTGFFSTVFSPQLTSRASRRDSHRRFAEQS